ncbi:MAG: hypothetical protein RMK99_05525 [Anaerolineales bacterium]|nr:hypothetical protein [Anaerolineales bacterium]
MTDRPMMGDVSSSITGDDKLWSLLAYILSPIVPIIILLLEDKKNRPFIRSHNAQALILGIIAIINALVLSWALIGCCTGLLLFGYQVYLGVQAYQGRTVTIPIITDFVKNQGWA